MMIIGNMENMIKLNLMSDYFLVNDGFEGSSIFN